MGTDNCHLQPHHKERCTVQTPIQKVPCGALHRHHRTKMASRIWIPAEQTWSPAARKTALGAQSTMGKCLPRSFHSDRSWGKSASNGTRHAIQVHAGKVTASRRRGSTYIPPRSIDLQRVNLILHMARILDVASHCLKVKSRPNSCKRHHCNNGWCQ